MSVVIEAAVESPGEAMAAVAGGADRLELCANLGVGGTTPSPEMLGAVGSAVHVPVFAMIRPRAGPFVYTAGERDEMQRDIEVARRRGAAGVVLGMLDERGDIDVRGVRELLGHDFDLPVTFHRAFDELPDQLAALDVLIELGVDRVLTSGGATSAIAGVDSLRALVAHAGDRIVVMAGGGVRGHNAAAIVRSAGVHELHARCELDPSRIREIRLAVQK